MLETVLKIGKAFRESSTGLKHHRYVVQCLPDTEKKKVLRLSLPVRDDFSFDFNGIKEITDENVIRDKLFYLTFKTSDSDTSIKYVFGDIYFYLNKNGNEGGNYRTGIYSKYSAFDRAETVLHDLSNKRVIDFRKAFIEQSEQIDATLLKPFICKTEGEHNEVQAVFLHFDFLNGAKEWYEANILNELTHLMVNQFCSEISKDNVKGFVFDSMLYRTICSGDQKNDIQFPFLSNRHKYKSRLFSNEDINNLFYGINYTEKPSLKPFDFGVGGAREKIKIIVLPRGENLKAKDYEDYILSREDVIRVANEGSSIDKLFAPLTEQVASEIVSFDVIFCKEGQNTDSDIIEITNLEKSLVRWLRDRTKDIRIPIEDQCGRILSVTKSFFNIFRDYGKTGKQSHKKYQKHLFSVIPQIYTGTYYRDPLLLSGFIEKVEHNIRNAENDKFNSRIFNDLKFDFYFLTSIQNTTQEGGNLMKIQESQSYKIGLLLGELAEPFAAWRNDCPIKSFEKSYVGTLTRRIATIQDLINFKNFIDEKLTIHEKNFKNIKDTSFELAQILKDFAGRYDKNECAFGFFESYFVSVK